MKSLASKITYKGEVLAFEDLEYEYKACRELYTTKILVSPSQRFPDAVVELRMDSLWEDEGARAYGTIIPTATTVYLENFFWEPIFLNFVESSIYTDDDCLLGLCEWLELQISYKARDMIKGGYDLVKEYITTMNEELPLEKLLALLFPQKCIKFNQYNQDREDTIDVLVLILQKWNIDFRIADKIVDYIYPDIGWYKVDRYAKVPATPHECKVSGCCSPYATEHFVLNTSTEN